MPTVEELIALARRNEEIARNLFDIEVQIMNQSHTRDFFSKLLTLVKEKFSIDHVWVVLTEIPSNQVLVRALDSSEGGSSNLLKRIGAVDFLNITKSEKDPMLINRGLGRYRAIVPDELWGRVASMAVLPLMMDGRIIGSLNLGARDIERYHPGKDSFFLKQLAVKASISMVNVAAREQISFLATRDPLTLLRNRREMEESLDQELSRCRRHTAHLAVMFIDCDDFKLVNDTYGHDCGDAYLKHVADSLNTLIRKGDTAFRFAGDEFVVILPNQTTSGAEVIAQRIREYLLGNPLLYKDQQIPVVISFGVASTDLVPEFQPKVLLKKADEALYVMKGRKQPDPASITTDQ